MREWSIYQQAEEGNEKNIRGKADTFCNGAYNEARYFQGLTEEDTSQVEAARTTYQAIIAQAPPDDRWRQQAEERLRELGQ